MEVAQCPRCRPLRQLHGRSSPVEASSGELLGFVNGCGGLNSPTAKLRDSKDSGADQQVVEWVPEHVPEQVPEVPAQVQSMFWSRFWNNLRSRFWSKFRSSIRSRVQNTSGSGGESGATSRMLRRRPWSFELPEEVLVEVLEHFADAYALRSSPIRVVPLICLCGVTLT